MFHCQLPSAQLTERFINLLHRIFIVLWLIKFVMQCYSIFVPCVTC